ncbi:class I SAM-dependent methyltransferase [Candidatus Nitrosarchaeum limnium]|uniref:Methyltransferase domain protein n=1 Tax=Candidatus Nitrosarchaeum limnium BG20 TaxID=859192 RepID=S2EL05_9ARCH|nr:class I SAM-dependent methyltransferase [Candidatus Nitrosarchaeum limnium]EPA05317.1 methyltransferase domain protein [Candidatus Nitrosarchaeum limnium BG20]
MVESCCLCKYKNLKVISNFVRDSPIHKIVKCLNCNHIQLSPFPKSISDEIYYNNDQPTENIKFSFSIKNIENRSSVDLTRRINLIKKITPKNGRILEIGSGHGFLLKKLQELKFSVTGIEVSKDRRIISKKVAPNVQVLDMDVNGNIPKISNLDSIVMFHVLEHIVDPIIFLKKARKLLSKNGKIIVEVPNINDLQLDQNEYYRNWYWQRAHLHYFSPNILKNIFLRSGMKNMKIIAVQRYSLENMFNWSLLKKPQIQSPSFQINKNYAWLEDYYKSYLSKKFISDTILVVGTK